MKKKHTNRKELKLVMAQTTECPNTHDKPITAERPTRKCIGKIKSVRFGSGGYQDAMFGLSVDLGSDKESWGVGDFKGMWGPEIDSKGCQWTEADRDAGYAKMVRFVADLMQKAKVSEVHKLAGTPVEVEFDGNCLKSWRVLEEVL